MLSRLTALARAALQRRPVDSKTASTMAPVATVASPHQRNTPVASPAARSASRQGMIAIIDALTDAALLLDPACNLLHGNTLARETFGQLSIGAHVSRTTRNQELAAAVIGVMKSNQRVLFELMIRGPVERRLEGAATALVGHGGDDAYILVVLQDLSERDALARMRVEFVANASHELRTPLTSLAGFIETLSGSAKDDPVARLRFLGIMGEQAARMRRLIDDLLLLSRVEMRAHLAPTQTVDLNSVVGDAIKVMGPLAQDLQTALQFTPLTHELLVRGDHDELVQAVQNLIQNAIKYGRPAGHVAITTALADGRARVSVTDDGPGIAAEHLPRLTERFYRVSTPSNRDKSGTGLGLAIVKHIASRHHGRLDISSEPGHGATFSIWLPTL
jgi:two-component system, OmpR family, phosphate regulon sensor histidine kinase PhoR